tara:strand:+ start:180 stop:323 length:144 start_codon:yes stop_codon:yes gene_type:complete
MNTELQEQLDKFVEQIGGTVKHTTTYDSTGRQSKKIVIEYDVTRKTK